MYTKKLSYYNLFKIKEIEESKTLQVLFYVISLSFFVTFYGWVESSAISISTFLKGSHLCPPYFLDCGKFYFLEGNPYGYTQGFFYVGLFLVLLYGIISALKKNWETAHKTLLISLIWKVIFIFFLTYGMGGNFDYYDMILAFVWLFTYQKEYFLRLTFVIFYFMASTIKIHEGWILGNYFTSTITGLPFLNDITTLVFTNIVIVMQIVGCWFLLSNNKNLQRLAFIYFLTFHTYSGIIVNYRYITISVTALIVLFGYNFKLFQIENTEKKNLEILPISKKTLFGYLVLVSLLLCQSIGLLIPGDQKKTMEGNFYGLYMFEANHQCISVTSVQYKNGHTKNVIETNKIAKNRCDPYQYWYHIKTECDRDIDVKKISWTFDHSINGHKYQRIVSEDNACTLTYLNLRHNAWIKLDSEAKELDTPVYKNGYSRNLYNESYIIPTNPIDKNRSIALSLTYKILWIMTLTFIIYKVISK